MRTIKISMLSFFYFSCLLLLQKELSKRQRDFIKAPKMALPGHAESYNPPPEYVPTKEEVLWVKLVQKLECTVLICLHFNVTGSRMAEEANTCASHQLPPSQVQFLA